MSLPRSRFARPARPERKRSGGGWLSLFAMWMLFIGPLVSQSMPMNHHAGMDMLMAMPAAHHAEASDHHGRSHDGQLHVLWEKCGYCSLLFNCPALPQSLSPLGTNAVPCPACPAIATLQGHARQAVFPGARSRAPPHSIST